MGMTIDKAISHLYTYSSTMGSGQTTQEQHEDAKRVAVDTMRKYQKLEQEPTAKNDVGVDCVVRQDVERYIEGFINEYTPKEELEFINLELDGLKHLPSVTPQEPTIKALGEELRKARKVIADEKVLIGYNMAVAICNKHLGESKEDAKDAEHATDDRL